MNGIQSKELSEKGGRMNIQQTPAGNQANGYYVVMVYADNQREW